MGATRLDTWILRPRGLAARRDEPDAGRGRRSTCAGTNRVPWTSVSYDDAVAACEAAGARLCAQSEWRQACSCGGTGATGSPLYYDFGWPSGGACTSTHTTAESQCNIADSGNAIDPTGTSSNCRITQNGTGVYDLTGNVKELTLAQNTVGAACDPSSSSTCRIQVRGGASSNTAVGAACGYDRSYWPDDAPFYNVGFRCCSGPDPRTVDKGCTTFTGSAASATGTLSTNLIVSGSPITYISSVRLTMAGASPDLDDLTAHLVRSGTDTTMVNMGPCNNNLNVTYNVTFSDSAGSAPSVTGTCDNLRNGGTFTPASASRAFNTIAANGTWQLQLVDSDTGDTNTVTSWSLQICGYGPP